MATAILVDARNWADLKPALLDEISNCSIIGFDIETHDADRHDGLNEFMKVNEEGHKSKAKKLVFDTNRTTVTGFSWYCDGSEFKYYLNLMHADVENRLPWSEAEQLLDAIPEEANTICHNAPFELTMMKKSLGYDLRNVICTLQMAVSTFNADQYPRDKFFGKGFGGIARMVPAIAEAFAVMDPSGEMTEKQADIFGTILGKTSTSAASYNTFMDEIAFGYGLKKLTKSFFDFDQATFEETLAGKAHMGQLTGEQVVEYGADDAYWAVKIFHKLLPMMMAQNDKLIHTFLEQENPMIYVFSEIWQNGMRVNRDQVHRRREEERQRYAETVREFQSVVRQMLPFPAAPCDGLSKEKWYADGKGQNYRRRIEAWANQILPEDPFRAAYSTGGAVSTAWAAEQGIAQSKGPNFTHYMMMRTVVYDLGGAKVLVKGGKVQSDGDARQKLIKRAEEGSLLHQALTLINTMTDIEQRVKLYLNPYLLLCDPETERMYPVVTSELNSRRMASAVPNAMQLSKRGESTYVRGFFLPDEDDHVIISIDWSQIELVLIGDFSEDEGFKEAYGQIPFNDLHWKAVGDMFGTDDPKSLPNAKRLRTDVGKGSNFNYWYSGALNTVGERMGWSSDKMWEMTEKYRETFPQAEEWRVETINEARFNGYVTLPDGHRRTKFEATYEWQEYWKRMWAQHQSPGLDNFGNLFVKKITNRAGNQIVNSLIQGSCATLAKRSILKIRKKIEELGLRARFMIPIHDELVFSVHREDVIAFLHMARHEMCDHPEIIRNLCVDATASMGRTFEPYHPEKAPFGQIELDEAPLLKGWLPEDTKDGRLNDDQITNVINYLFQKDPTWKSHKTLTPVIA